VTCQELSVDDLFQILKNSEGSIMRQYVQAFEAYGIQLSASDEGLRRLAELAYQERTGARSLVGVCERTFREFKYQLPDSGVRRLELTTELVDSPLQVLSRLTAESYADQLRNMDSSVNRFAELWSERHGIEIRLDPEAARLLSQKAMESHRSLEEVFEETFRNYEHGLNLIRKTRGITRFDITPDVIQDPEATLDRWIRAYFISKPG
jgi:ATP-dependent protease Clp ATPase subunit